MNQKLFSFILIFTITTSVWGQNRIETADYLPYIHRDSIQKTMQDLEDFTTRYAALGNRHVAEYIQQRLVNYGVANAEIDSFYKNVSVWYDPEGDYARYYYNVKGTVAGSQNPDSIVIVGAHYDAINLVFDYENYAMVLNKRHTPGADDNASGVAMMLEMARIIHQYDLKPQNRIDFIAFDAEEIGLNGAEHDAKKRVTENDKVVIMINNDMVSYQPVNEDYKINIHWYDNAVAEADLTAELMTAYSSITPVLPQGEDNDGREASDSWEYALQGIKSIFMIEYYFTPHYHTENDLCVNSNFEYAQEVGKVNFALLNHYAKLCQSGVGVVVNEEVFSVYPNPISQYASISISSFAEGAPYTFQLFDMYGRLCHQHSLTQKRTAIDLSEFAPGLYVVKITTPNGNTSSQKIVKN